MPDNGSDPWYVQSVVRDADGNVMSPADGLVNDKGEAIAWPTQVIDGKTVTVIPHHQIAPGIDAAARPVVQEVLRKLKQQPRAQGPQLVDPAWCDGRRPDAHAGAACGADGGVAGARPMRPPTGPSRPSPASTAWRSTMVRSASCPAG